MIETKRAAMRIPTTVTHDVTTPSQESVDLDEPNSPASTANSTSSLGYSLGEILLLCSRINLHSLLLGWEPWLI